jgi:hypothetical protein
MPPRAQIERSTPRQRVLLSGKLVFGAAAFSVDCTIKDQSKKGARVQLAVDLGFARGDPVWLIELRSGVAYLATVAWREGPDLGLTATELHDLKSPTPYDILHLRLIWLEWTARMAAESVVSAP